MIKSRPVPWFELTCLAFAVAWCLGVLAGSVIVQLGY